jgi:hypothetical protein
MQGIMEPPTFLSDESTFSWYDEQMMMSTVAVHGFCFYAKHIVDAGSKLGFANMVDITSEMLTSTTNIMALGKLSRQDHTKPMSNFTKEILEVNNPRNDKKRYIYSHSFQFDSSLHLLGTLILFFRHSQNLIFHYILISASISQHAI